MSALTMSWQECLDRAHLRELERRAALFTPSVRREAARGRYDAPVTRRKPLRVFCGFLICFVGERFCCQCLDHNEVSPFQAVLVRFMTEFLGPLSHSSPYNPFEGMVLLC